jgi:Single-strand binding protein family
VISNSIAERRFKKVISKVFLLILVNNQLKMRGLNKVTLIGNLGKDPDVQTLEGNVKVAKFSLATTETYKDSNNQTHTVTDWHTILLWRGLAAI